MQSSTGLFRALDDHPLAGDEQAVAVRGRLERAPPAVLFRLYTPFMMRRRAFDPSTT